MWIFYNQFVTLKISIIITFKFPIIITYNAVQMQMKMLSFE